jgi:hypothetical protein
VTAPNSVAVTTEGNLGLEPTWCFCEGPSHNEMIGCDNDECIREWFHYACVGITEPPKGKWFTLDRLVSISFSLFRAAQVLSGVHRDDGEAR